MTNFVVLDKNKHKDTRIQTGHGEQFGENTHLVPVVADELRHLILEYPVCLVKNHETGQFGLHAMLGFEPQENLFLNKDEWSASYVPLHIRRQPFMAKVVTSDEGIPTNKNTLITINEDNARVQTEHGERLFDDQGEPTDYIKHVNAMLGSLLNGMIRTESFINQLSEHDLIESIQLNVSFENGEKKHLNGIYVINEEKLKQLDPSVIHQLHQNGYLQACYLLLTSMGHVQTLVTLKNSRAKQKT